VPTMNPGAARGNFFHPTQIPQMRAGPRWQTTVRPTQPGGGFQSGAPQMRPTRPSGPAGGVAATGQPQMRPSSAINARPITGQSTAQPMPGMTMPQNTMPGRPQQPQAPNMPQPTRPGYQPARAPQPGAGQSIVVPGQDALTASMLAAAPPQEQKQMLGERLFPLIQRMHPELAGKITGMLLEIDNSELLHMLESHESLKAKVEEAVAVLQAHQAKEAAANQAATNAKKKDMA